MERMMRAAKLAMALAGLCALTGCTMGDLPLKKSIDDLGSSWKGTSKLPALAEASASDSFGELVALSSDTLAVAHGNSSEVVLYASSGTSTGSLHSFTLPDVPTSLAIDAGMLAVGISASDTLYVYYRIAGVWSDSPDTVTGPASTAFGQSVGISGNTLVVGAPYASSAGLAYTYTYSGSAWTVQNVLKPSDAASGDQFGWSVAISGKYAIVGANTKKVGLINGAGTAYVYWYNGSYWGTTITNSYENKKLVLASPALNDAFGQAVGVDSTGAALIGAPGHNAAFVYRDQGANNWSLESTLVPKGGVSTDGFGWSVALSGDFAAVGAPNASSHRGTTFASQRIASAWTTTELPAKDGAANDEYGWTVAIRGTALAVGAHYAMVNSQVQSGAAYRWAYGR